MAAASSGVLLCGCALACALAQPLRAAGQAAPPRVPDTMEARVAACVGCHGKAGRGVARVYFPRLAGKPAGYLYHQLVAFRDGRRKYVPMNYLLAYLPDAYLYKMAQHFAAQDPAPPHAADPAPSAQALAAGRRIAMEGVPARGIPACASCHGSGLAGREPGIPGLLGLRADYLAAQLGAWRYGVRTALAPDCMQLVAAGLDETEVAAVSAWLAALPVGAARPARPAARAGDALPLPCGSQDTPLPEPRP